jgi:DNA modification methylase
MRIERSNFPQHSIEHLSVRSLKRNSHNARQHPQKQIDQIAKSIDKFGLNIPVIVDEQLNVIRGNAVLAAAEQLGMTEIPAIRISHLTEAEKRAFAIADNKLAQNASWDLPTLKSELQFFAVDLDFDFSAIGFETAEVDIILDKSVEESAKDNILPGGAPARPPITVPGDIWRLGESRLICGNALDGNDYAALLGDERARAIIADSPYNVRIDGHAGGLGGVKHREFAMASGEMAPQEFIAFLTEVFWLLTRFSLNGSLHYQFMDWRHTGELLSAAGQVYSQHKNICVWAKTNAGMGSFYRSQHEFVHVFKNGTAPHINNVQLGAHGRNRSNLWTYQGINSFGRQRDDLLALHPTVKPVALVADIIRDCSERGDLVLDPFAGSGTTLIAAEKIGRRAALLEIDPLYCDVIVRRWQAYTGAPAVRSSTDRTFDEHQSEVSDPPSSAPQILIAPPANEEARD